MGRRCWLVRERERRYVARTRPLREVGLNRGLLIVALVLVTAPVWIVKHPPLEDLPLHLATLRVVHSLHDPVFGLDDFALTLNRTQCVSFYLVGSALAYVTGVSLAAKLLLAGYLAGTPLATLSLLRALGRDPRVACFVVPLLFNSLFALGLVPFLMAIPLLIWALAAFLRHLASPRRRSAVAVAVLGVILFLTHLLPFLVFLLGVVILFPWGARQRWVTCAASVIPSIVALFAWMFGTDSGRQVLDAALSPSLEEKAGLVATLTETHRWVFDIFCDHSDEALIVASGVVVAVAFALSSASPNTTGVKSPYFVLPLACAAFYLAGSKAHGFIWPLSQRFVVIAAVLSVPLLRFPEGRAGRALTPLAVLVGVLAVANTSQHFFVFERDEVRGFDAALAVMPPRAHVAALIFARDSKIAQFSPFLHFGSYYQAEKGGVVEFTFAGYNHWPIDFKPGHYPPPGGPARPRWEWSPELVSVKDELYPYDDYVLTRGGPFTPEAGTFHLKWRDERWAVWERDGL